MKRTYLLGALLLFGLLTSCETTETTWTPPEGNNPNPENPLPTAQQFSAVRTLALQNITQDFTFNASDPVTTYISENGVELTIYGGCLTRNGNPVTGNVDLEFVEIFNRGTMLVTNKPTMGAISGGSQQLLISGGEFYVNITQNGVQLESTCGVQLMVPASLTGGLDNDMLPFTGIIDANGNLVWNPEQTEFWAGGETNEQPAYYALLQSFGWFNCDKFANFQGEMTDIEIIVPAGYNNQNSSIFIALPGELNTLGNLSGNYPVGLQCYIIFVTATADGGFAYAIKNVTLTADASYTFTSGEIQEVTEANFIALINALP